MASPPPAQTAAVDHPPSASPAVPLTTIPTPSAHNSTSAPDFASGSGPGSAPGPPPSISSTPPTALLWAHQLKREHAHLAARMADLEAREAAHDTRLQAVEHATTTAASTAVPAAAAARDIDNNDPNPGSGTTSTNNNDDASVSLAALAQRIEGFDPVAFERRIAGVELDVQARLAALHDEGIRPARLGTDGDEHDDASDGLLRGAGFDGAALERRVALVEHDVQAGLAALQSANLDLARQVAELQQRQREREGGERKGDGIDGGVDGEVDGEVDGGVSGDVNGGVNGGVDDDDRDDANGDGDATLQKRIDEVTKQLEDFDALPSTTGQHDGGRRLREIRELLHGLTGQVQHIGNLEETLDALDTISEILTVSSAALKAELEWAAAQSKKTSKSSKGSKRKTTHGDDPNEDRDEDGDAGDDVRRATSKRAKRSLPSADASRLDGPSRKTPLKTAKTQIMQMSTDDNALFKRPKKDELLKSTQKDAKTAQTDHKTSHLRTLPTRPYSPPGQAQSSQQGGGAELTLPSVPELKVMGKKVLAFGRGWASVLRTPSPEPAPSEQPLKRARGRPRKQPPPELTEEQRSEGRVTRHSGPQSAEKQTPVAPRASERKRNKSSAGGDHDGESSYTPWGPQPAATSGEPNVDESTDMDFSPAAVTMPATVLGVDNPGPGQGAAENGAGQMAQPGPEVPGGRRHIPQYDGA